MFRDATNRNSIAYISCAAIALLLLFACNTASEKMFSGYKEIDVFQIPPSVTIPGTIKQAGIWHDNTGENILLLSRTPDLTDIPLTLYDSSVQASIHAGQWVKTDTGYRKVWQLMDQVKQCELNLILNFFEGSTSVTDLDHNGIAEVTMVYYLGCLSEVSAYQMKLIMREGDYKYALRGFTCDPFLVETKKEPCISADSIDLKKIRGSFTDEELAQTGRLYGAYQSASDFTNAPPVFLDFARRQWLKYRMAY